MGAILHKLCTTEEKRTPMTINAEIAEIAEW